MTPSFSPRSPSSTRVGEPCTSSQSAIRSPTLSPHTRAVSGDLASVRPWPNVRQNAHVIDTCFHSSSPAALATIRRRPRSVSACSRRAPTRHPKREQLRVAYLRGIMIGKQYGCCQFLDTHALSSVAVDLCRFTFLEPFDGLPTVMLGPRKHRHRTLVTTILNASGAQFDKAHPMIVLPLHLRSGVFEFFADAFRGLPQGSAVEPMRLRCGFAPEWHRSGVGSPGQACELSDNRDQRRSDHCSVDPSARRCFVALFESRKIPPDRSPWSTSPDIGVRASPQRGIGFQPRFL